TSVIPPRLANPEPGILTHDAFMTADADLSYATGNNFTTLESTGFSLNLTYSMRSGMTLRYIGSTRELESLFGFDFDGSPLPMLEPSFDTYQRQYSHEVQLSNVSDEGRFDWTVGAYFFHEDEIGRAHV